MKSALVSLIIVLFACTLAAASPAKVYQGSPDAFSIGGVRIGMTEEQAVAVVGTPDKKVAQSLYYDPVKKALSLATFRSGRTFQIFGSQVEYKGKAAKTSEQMEKLLGPPSVKADANSSYWYVESPNARLIVVFSSENGKPYCSLIDRTGKDF